MSLPAFATLDDYTVRFPDATSADPSRAPAALEDASTTIRGFVRSAMVDDSNQLDFSKAAPWAPDTFRKVCIACARRVLVNPDGLDSETIAGYAYQQSNSSADAYLKQSEKDDLIAAVNRSPYGVWTMPTTRSIDDMPDVPSVTIARVFPEDLVDVQGGEPAPYDDGW